MSPQKPVVKYSASESLWIEEKSIRRLMQSRRSSTGIAILALLLMAVVLRGAVSDVLIVGWVFAALLVLTGRNHLKTIFNTRLAKSKHSKKVAFVERRLIYWQAYALVWGMSGWQFFTNSPAENKQAGHAILTVVAIISIFNLSSHRKVSAQFINVMQGVQVVGSMWYIGVMENFNVPRVQYAHLLAMIALWVVYIVLINRFYKNFYKTNALQYQNLNLIQSLSHQTEQLVIEKKNILDANETIKRFYSSAAHDIRQPVYALNVYADLISDDLTQTQKLLPKIKASCLAINALFSSLFDFEKIQSGQFNVALETVDLSTMFHELQVHFQPIADGKNIDLRVFPVFGRLQSDHTVIKSILSHLIANAIKYTNQGGVLLAARKSGKNISFEVWDTGIGIDGMNQKQVFDEFFKVNEQSSADEGFGLGLSVVKRLASFVDGSNITLQSQLGRGSVFKFTIPLTAYTK